MITKLIVEDVSGNLNRRYFAEIESNEEVAIRREGESPREAARKAVASLRYLADDAERKFQEKGAHLNPQVENVLGTAAAVLATVRRDVPNFAGALPVSVQEALNLLSAAVDGHVQIGPKRSS